MLADGQGGFLIAWLESPRSGNSRDYWALRAQKLDLAGVGQWSTSPLASSASTENMHDVGIVADDAGGATVVWRTGTSPSKDGRIRAQRLDAAGNARWPAEDIMIYADTTRYQGFPRIISDGKGGIIAAFLQGNTAQDARVYAQRVGPAGDLLWPRAAVGVFP